MKLSNKLLIGTLILLFGGLIYFNSVLNSVYKEINLADEFYEFNQEKDLKFEHVKVNGGNDGLISIEKGESNSIYVYKRLEEHIEYKIINDTLIVDFDEYLTDLDKKSFRDQGDYFPDVIIHYQDIKTLDIKNSRVEFTYDNSTPITARSSGANHFKFISNSKGIEQLTLITEDNSTTLLSQEGESSNIKILNLILKGESYVDLGSINSDSIQIQIEENARIKCGPNFLSQTIK